MSLHSHYSLLKRYLDAPADQRWVLAMVVDKEGSSYRKPGAMMLVSELGQSFGLVSGGCLEADIVRRANQVLQNSKPQYAIYDMLEEGSYAADLGIGCNGKIGILIQELNAEHRTFYQTLFSSLENGDSCRLLQMLPQDATSLGDLCAVLVDKSNTEIARIGESTLTDSAFALHLQSSFEILHDGNHNWSNIPFRAPFSVWVFGGGADAQPLVRMAAELGWRISVVDHRTAYARPALFTSAEQVIREHPDNFDRKPELNKADAAILMTHNLTLDSVWIKRLSQTDISYVALLGPPSRRDKVLAMANISNNVWSNTVLHGPAGYDLGGELPESIALSILAQCHTHLYKHQVEPTILEKISHTV